MREAAWRVLGQRPYDVQVVGASALARGMIAEMKTGEGKTLVSTMPAYLNALGGQVSTSSPSTTTWQSEMPSGWDAPPLPGTDRRLIQNDMTPEDRRPPTSRHHLRDQQRVWLRLPARQHGAGPCAMVQRATTIAIVDEVDSILVDEARTPLIISGRVADTAKWYREFSRLVERLRARSITRSTRSAVR